MSTKNVQGLTEEIDALVSKLGLEKLSESGPVGESAGTVADPGTTQPAEQEANRSEIEPAKEGAQSAANNQILNDEVPANVSKSTPTDASNDGGASSPENTTTATMVGDDPKVEDGYGSRQQTLDAPSTAHPADVNKDPEKYSADLRDCASFIDAEIEKLAAANPVNGEASEAGAAAPAEGTAADPKEEGCDKQAADKQDADKQDAEPTVGDRIGELVLGKEASEADRDAAVVESVKTYLAGYSKTASVIGELTADALDAMVKKAEGEGEDMGSIAEGTPEDAMETQGVPATELEAGAAGAEAGVDDEAAAIAQAAEMIAAQLGVSPEEVLNAAAAELEGGAGGEAAPAGGEGAAPPVEEGAGEEKIASAELADLRAKAAELAQLKTDQEKKASDEHLRSLISESLVGALQEASKRNVPQPKG